VNGQVQTGVMRFYDVSGPAWRVVVFVGLRAGYHPDWETTTGLPMASAVVDDFGQLVLVTPWH